MPIKEKIYIYMTTGKEFFKFLIGKKTYIQTTVQIVQRQVNCNTENINSSHKSTRNQIGKQTKDMNRQFTETGHI